METLTHWKKLQHPLYIGAYELMLNEIDNKELVVKIETVKREMVQGPDGKKEECTIMTIPPHKPMILNATNQKTLTKAIGSPFIENWSGKMVTLYVAKVRAFGETLDALRIRDTLYTPPALPTLDIKHPKWNDAKQSIKDGKTTVEAIKKAYTLTLENEKELLK